MPNDKNQVQNTIDDAFSKYYAEIYRFCLSYLTKDRASVDDCVQETFIVLYNKLMAGEEIVNLRAYLYKIAENNARSMLRSINKHQQNISIDEVIDIPSQREDMDEQLTFEEYSRQISEALSDKEAELFRMRYIDDLPIEKIASLLDITFSAAGVRLHRLKKKLVVIIKDIMV